MRFFASRKAKPLQLSLPCSKELAKGVGQLAASAASSLGVNGAVSENIAQAVQEVCENVIERACQADASRIIHCMIMPQGKTLVVRVTDQGTAFQFAGGNVGADAGFKNAVSLMDSIEHQVHPRGGNVFTLSKTIG